MSVCLGCEESLTVQPPQTLDYHNAGDCSSSRFSLCLRFHLVRSTPGDLSPLHLTIGTQRVGNVPFSIVPAGDTYRPSLGTGTIAWCIYSTSGVLERSYLTNRILGSTASSSDGQYLAPAGYRVSSGPAGFYGYGAVYLFDHDGIVKWNVSTTREVFSVQAGISDVLFPGHTNYGGELVMFSAKENALWNFTIPDQQFDSTTDVAVSSDHIAAGVSASDYSGTLYYFDLRGNEIWSRHLDSAILSVNFDSGGSTISTLTNWDLVKFDLQGNVISNQTRTSF